MYQQPLRYSFKYICWKGKYLRNHTGECQTVGLIDTGSAISTILEEFLNITPKPQTVSLDEIELEMKGC